jgi:TonB family protein
MRLAVLLFCCALAFGQNTSSAPETKSQAPANSPDQKSQDSDVGFPGHQFGSLDILSDTQGVNFGPYLQRILQDVKENWYHLIPESASMKKGKLAIEFAITKDGRVADMRLVSSSGDVGLDRPAWGSIAASNPFPPLPGEFTGPYVALRFRFYYNPDKSDLATPLLSATSAPSKSGVVVSIISTPDGLHVPVGGTEIVALTVTGAKDSSVEWTVSGPGCSGSACGKMIGDVVYVAPSARPNPPDVTLMAVSKADPTAKASVIVHILEPASKTASKP